TNADQRAPKIDGRIRLVPLVGDETNLVRVKASPGDYVDKDIYLCGQISVSDYFGLGYSDATKTHYSFQLCPVKKNGAEVGGDYCTIYADRRIASPLVSAIADHQEQAMLIRVKVTLSAERAKEPEPDFHSTRG